MESYKYTLCKRCYNLYSIKDSCLCSQHLVYVTNDIDDKIDSKNFKKIWVQGIGLEEKSQNIAKSHHDSYPDDYDCLYVFIDDKAYEVKAEYIVGFTANEIDPKNPDKYIYR